MASPTTNNRARESVCSSTTDTQRLLYEGTHRVADEAVRFLNSRGARTRHDDGYFAQCAQLASITTEETDGVDPGGAGSLGGLDYVGGISRRGDGNEAVPLASQSEQLP